MKRFLSMLALSTALGLGACAISPSSIASDAQALLAAAEANGSISAADGLIVQDVITGYAVISSAESSAVSAGDSGTLTAAKSLSAAITQLTTDDVSSTVNNDAKAAQALLGDIINSSTTTVTQSDLEIAVGTFLIDYLAAGSSASATPGNLSPTAALILDAREKLAALHH
ncbi:MAG TPA: hypothetical protein VHX12_14655 [Acidisoma sp.]|nr:hypothetical protein [Acidisoma sp.]